MHLQCENLTRETMEYAPIVLFVYNRPKHTLKTLEALALNEISKYSDLIVFADGPKQHATDNEKKKIIEVREILTKKKWCRNIRIHNSKVNIGLANSIINGVSKVINEYGSVIVLEDDLITSPYFLKFMNDGLTKYKNDDRIASVNAYFLNVNETLPETFFLNFADCLGWATWKRSWDLLEMDGTKLLNQIKKRNLVEKFNFKGGYNYSDLLDSQTKGHYTSWAILWYASTFLHNKLSLCTNQSFVFHNGNDGSGTNFGSSDFLDVTIKNTPVLLKTIKVVESSKAYNAMAKHFLYMHKQHKNSRYKTRALIKLFIPPILISLKNKIKNRNNIKLKSNELEPSPIWSGDYKSWDEAQNSCLGYDNEIILRKCKDSILKVKNGEAVYERDSVLFEEIQYSWAVLATLLRAGIENNNHLSVIDFGGSLGSSYYQNKDFTSGLSSIKWSVVEQKNFVKAGKIDFEDDILKFYTSIEECLIEQNPNVLLLSSVLQYLECPKSFIEKIIPLDFNYIIIDRTAFSESEDDILTVQNVPDSVYAASYPAWFFNKNAIKQMFEEKYDLISSFNNGFTPPILLNSIINATWSGMIYKLKE